MTEQTHWLEYGEPNEDGTVDAIHTVSYQTGPGAVGKDQEVTHGTITWDGLERGWEENEDHVHDDGSLLLSALPIEEHDAIMQEFKA